MEQAGEGLTAGLAKGLRMLNGDTDLSEEGMGFGVPVIVSRHRTYLSYAARETESGKTFMMDAIQTIRAKTFAGTLPYRWLELKGRVYKSFPFAQNLMLKSSAAANLTPNLGFEPCESMGEIHIDYKTDDNGAYITVNLADISNIYGSPRIYVLNEQGGRAFPFFWEQGLDSREQADRKVGWKKVTGSAAGFTNSEKTMAFTLSKLPGADMFSGREVVGDVLSWSGVDYDVTALLGSNFTYRVDIKGSKVSL